MKLWKRLSNSENLSVFNFYEDFSSTTTPNKNDSNNDQPFMFSFLEFGNTNSSEGHTLTLENEMQTEDFYSNNIEVKLILSNIRTTFYNYTAIIPFH